MRVKLRQLMAGPEGVFYGGSVIDLPDTRALQLYESGQADLVDGPPPATDAAPEGDDTVETAESKSVQSRETAAGRKPRK